MKTTLDMIHLDFFENIKQAENSYIILSSSVKKGLLKLKMKLNHL
jgi:hypothetical protein